MPYKDKAAQSRYQSEWMKRRRLAWIDEHGPCVDCGGSDRLEVDHVDPALKVSHRVWSWAKARRDAELAKCVVRCYRCHKAKTKVDVMAAHGTRARYENHGCKCSRCSAAKRRHNARRSYDPITKRVVWDPTIDPSSVAAPVPV